MSNITESQTTHKRPDKAAAHQAIRMGFDSLNEVSELCGVSRQTLSNWSKRKPKLFAAVLRGCLSK